MKNKKDAERYLLQCRMISEWGKIIKALQEELKESRDFYWRKVLSNRLKLSKGYFKRCQRGLNFLQTGKKPSNLQKYPSSIYRYFIAPRKTLKFRDEE